ncbi:MAG: DUF4296 domain-containing protein [Polaribacter sp.]|jgi:hypothetical protein|nr:DUF4296 domain-containing protein [Polaribacter sp.]MDG2357020.1 DUF4296 domain-containing protein [Polaribacter sp.]
MKKQKVKELLLRDRMKKYSYIFVLLILFSCTSNTIFKKPKDLIPKDSMSHLIQEMYIASSAKFIKNNKQQNKINYMPFVNEVYNIDSSRFQNSNYYYMSKIDEYEEILTDAKTNLEKRKETLNKLKVKLDSARKDSLKKIKLLDSLKKPKVFLDTLKSKFKKNSNRQQEFIKNRF